MSSCSICNNDCTVCCCASLFCESCIGLHIMNITESKHKPLMLNMPRDSLLTEAIRSRLTNEILELEEFRRSFTGSLTSFLNSLRKEIDDFGEKITLDFMQKYRQILTEIQQACSCLYTNNVKNEIVEYFSECCNKEDVKKIKFTKKNISLPILTLKEQLSKCMDFDILIGNFTKDELSQRPLIDLRASPENDESSEKILRAQSFIGPVSNNRFRVLNVPRPVFHTVHTVISYTGKILSYEVKQKIVSEIVFDRVKFPSKAAWSLTKDGRLIITGGYDDDAKKNAFSVMLFERKYEEISKLNTARYNHSQLTVDQNVYIIGGANRKSIAECERYSLEKKKWFKFGSLVVARECPSIACVLGKIYVAGGNGIETIECANLAKEKFELLMLRLPGPGRCNLFCYENQLFVIHKGKYITISIPSHMYAQVGQSKEHNYWTPAEYLVSEGHVYWSSFGQFINFDFVAKDFVPL